MSTTTKEPTRIRDLRSGSQDMNKIDPRLIEIEEGHNPRDYSLAENREHLEALKSSIREQGVLQPLWVRWDGGGRKIILVDGECRLRAVQELIAEGVPIESVPTLQVQGNNEADRLLLALTANTGKPFSKWEDGAAFRKLMAFGWTKEKIASSTGKSARYITDAIELSDSPQEVKRMLSEGSVTPARALASVRKNGSAAVDELAGAVEKAKETGGVAKRAQTNGFRLTEETAAHMRETLEGCLQSAQACGNDTLSQRITRDLETLTH